MVDWCMLQVVFEFGDQFEIVIDIFECGVWGFEVVWIGQVVGIDWVKVGQFQQCIVVFVDVVVIGVVWQFYVELYVMWNYCDLLWFDFDYVQFGQQVQCVQLWYDQQFIVGVVEVVVDYVVVGSVEVDVYVSMCIG